MLFFVKKNNLHQFSLKVGELKIQTQKLNGCQILLKDFS